ncbi:hypothetical protein ACUUL3_11625 [Thiovibrio sp. JS02]
MVMYPAGIGSEKETIAAWRAPCNGNENKEKIIDRTKKCNAEAHRRGENGSSPHLPLPCRASPSKKNVFPRASLFFPEKRWYRESNNAGKTAPHFGRRPLNFPQKKEEAHDHHPGKHRLG